MPHWLIDPTGTVWPADSERLRSRLGLAPRTSGDRARFLVANMGFIAVEQLGNGLGVRWRPTYTQRETVAATIIHLREQGEQRVVISTIDNSEIHSLFSGISEACDAMLHRFAGERNTSGGYFLAKPRARDSLLAGSVLRKTLDEAVSRGLSYDPMSLWESLQRSVGSRFLLLDPDRSDRKLKVLSLGSGYTKMSRRWTSEAQGTDFEDQPDVSYARAAARAFWTAAQSGKPVIEDVEASMWVPSRGRSAVRYTRLVLPIEVNGRRRILSTSELHSFVPAAGNFA